MSELRNYRIAGERGWTDAIAAVFGVARLAFHAFISVPSLGGRLVSAAASCGEPRGQTSPRKGTEGPADVSETWPPGSFAAAELFSDLVDPGLQ